MEPAKIEPVKSEPVKPAPAKPEPPKPAAPPKPEARAAALPKPEARAVAPPVLVAVAVKSEAPRAGGDGSVLRFVFKGSSWVEIRDAKGKILLSRLNLAGSETEVSGKPPFNVIVGNAPEVQLFYNDHAFDLEPHTKVAVARFIVQRA